MTRYELLLFLHVLAAVVWIGGGFMVLALVARAGRTDDTALLQKLAESSGWLAQRIFIPASLLVLLLGIALTWDGPWSFGDLWIVLGLAGYAVSFLAGILFLEPEGKRIAAAMAAHGPASPQAAHHIGRINAVQRMEMVILILVIAVMVLKPSGDDTAALLVGGAILALTLAVGVRALARPAAAR